jgi:hypothetical protein
MLVVVIQEEKRDPKSFFLQEHLLCLKVLLEYGLVVVAEAAEEFKLLLAVGLVVLAGELLRYYPVRQ